MNHTVRVNLGARGYDVVVGAGHDVGSLVKAACPRSVRAALVVDPGVAGVGTPALLDSLGKAGLRAHAVVLDRAWLDSPKDIVWAAKSLTERGGPAESTKSLLSVEHLCDEFMKAGIDRRDVVVVGGGGIMGDLGGFAAAIYRRGIAWVNVPTTLLAMVDASVGGKTGANLFAVGSPLKNMVGVFHQPSLVVIDTRWLATLYPRQVRCGMAECIKHALLCRSVEGFEDFALLEFTRGLVRRGVDVSKDAGLAAELIARNVALKARVVERDEYETAPDDVGGRALLNLGHTFGHVLEGMPSLELLHGEAVGLGLVAAAHTARALRRVGDGYVAVVEELVSGAGLAMRIKGLPDSATLIGRMRGDKKTLGGVLRLILPFEPSAGVIGHAGVVLGPEESAVAVGWDALRA